MRHLSRLQGRESSDDEPWRHQQTRQRRGGTGSEELSCTILAVGRIFERDVNDDAKMNATVVGKLLSGTKGQS